MNEDAPKSEPADIFEPICLIQSDEITELPVGFVPWFQVRLNNHLGTLCTSRIDGPHEVLVVSQEAFNCIDLPPPENPKVRSDMYVRAKTAGIKITMRTVHENGAAVLRIWRTG